MLIPRTTLCSPANRNLDTTAAFESCVETGDIHLMGALYAAIWRDLRIAAREVSVKALRDIDTLFVKHIAELTADDTFLTVRRKILDLDSRLFNEEYGLMINQAFLNRASIN